MFFNLINLTLMGIATSYSTDTNGEKLEVVIDGLRITGTGSFLPSGGYQNKERGSFSVVNVRVVVSEAVREAFHIIFLAEKEESLTLNFGRFKLSGKVKSKEGEDFVIVEAKVAITDEIREAFYAAMPK